MFMFTKHDIQISIFRIINYNKIYCFDFLSISLRANEWIFLCNFRVEIVINLN